MSSPHSVLDLTDENCADPVRAYNYSALYGSMQDILNTEGLEALKVAVDDNIAIFEAGVN